MNTVTAILRTYQDFRGHPCDFYELLLTTSWKLANATPHWIQLLDSAFIQALRFKSHLGWKQSRNPALSGLYSRRDFDHARRLINALQFAQFPSGAGFEDMFKLYCRLTTPY